MHADCEDYEQVVTRTPKRIATCGRSVLHSQEGEIRWTVLEERIAMPLPPKISRLAVLVGSALHGLVQLLHSLGIDDIATMEAISRLLKKKTK